MLHRVCLLCHGSRVRSAVLLHIVFLRSDIRLRRQTPVGSHANLDVLASEFSHFLNHEIASEDEIGPVIDALERNRPAIYKEFVEKMKETVETDIRC